MVSPVLGGAEVLGGGGLRGGEAVSPGGEGGVSRGSLGGREGCPGGREGGPGTVALWFSSQLSGRLHPCLRHLGVVGHRSEERSPWWCRQPTVHRRARGDRPQQLPIGVRHQGPHQGHPTRARVGSHAPASLAANSCRCTLHNIPSSQHEHMLHDGGHRRRGDGHISMHGPWLTKSAEQENAEQVRRDGHLPASWCRSEWRPGAWSSLRSHQSLDLV